MTWREAASNYFPDIPLEPLRRAKWPSVPSSPENGEVDTPDTLARHAREAADQHVADWYEREERAAILEFEAGMKRRDAERKAGLRDGRAL